MVVALRDTNKQYRLIKNKYRIETYYVLTYIDIGILSLQRANVSYPISSYLLTSLFLFLVFSREMATV